MSIYNKVHINKIHYFLYRYKTINKLLIDLSFNSFKLVENKINEFLKK